MLLHNGVECSRKVSTMVIGGEGITTELSIDIKGVCVLHEVSIRAVDTVGRLTHHWGAVVDREGIELLDACLGVDVSGGRQGRNEDLGSRGRVGTDGGRWLHVQVVLQLRIMHGGGRYQKKRT